MLIDDLFSQRLEQVDGVYLLHDGESPFENQRQTNEAFTRKWSAYSAEEIAEQEKLFSFQKKWYLSLYGFSSEEELAGYLRGRSVIVDAGCGLGYKAKWFADLSPDSLVVGIDYSDAVFIAAERYGGVGNLCFVRGDIADTQIRNEIVDYVSCDQVIMHTENPEKTFSELVRILRPGGDFSVYVYAKKALPRELLDDYFRSRSKSIPHEEMMGLSKQVTELGRRLSELKAEIDVPDIPLLGIRGGRMNIQRFIYWNFLKCFWNEELGYATSVATNYDWYSPSNAKRYSEEEFRAMIRSHNLGEVHFHSEEACYSGRFRKPCVA